MSLAYLATARVREGRTEGGRVKGAVAEEGLSSHSCVSPSYSARARTVSTCAWHYRVLDYIACDWKEWINEKRDGLSVYRTNAWGVEHTVTN